MQYHLNTSARHFNSFQAMALGLLVMGATLTGCGGSGTGAEAQLTKAATATTTSPQTTATTGTSSEATKTVIAEFFPEAEAELQLPEAVAPDIATRSGRYNQIDFFQSPSDRYYIQSGYKQDMKLNNVAGYFGMLDTVNDSNKQSVGLRSLYLSASTINQSGSLKFTDSQHVYAEGDGYEEVFIKGLNQHKTLHIVGRLKIWFTDVAAPKKAGDTIKFAFTPTPSTKPDDAANAVKSGTVTLKYSYVTVHTNFN